MLTAAGCTTAPLDDEGETGGDAITSTQDFKVGDRLVATTGLNLREEPSATSRILGVIRSGGSVTVTAEEETAAAATPDEAAKSAGAFDAIPDAPAAPDPSPADGTDPSAPDDAAGDGTPAEDLPLPPIPPPEPPAQLQATNGFWHVTYGTKVGWASGRYLRKASDGDGDTTSANATGDASGCMNRLATVARRMDGGSSQSRCYHYVKQHVGTALGVGFSGVQTMLGGSYQVGAYDFARWVEANPGGRASAAGFVESNNIPLDALPLGAILVWRPGQCGYHRTYGHIEVNIGGGRACSDFCGRIRRTCGQPKIILLQKECR